MDASLLPPSAFVLASNVVDHGGRIHQGDAPTIAIGNAIGERPTFSSPYQLDAPMNSTIPLLSGSALANATPPLLSSQLDSCRLELHKERHRLQIAREENAALKRSQASLLADTERRCSQEARRQQRKHEEERRILLQEFEDRMTSYGEERASSIRDRDETIKSLRDELSRLHTYYKVKLPAQKTAPPVRWQEEKSHLEGELEKTQLAYSQLQSAFQLLNVRQTAMSRIVSLQEQQVFKSAMQGGKVTDACGDTRSDLLTLWREKVYALLIQQQLQEKEFSSLKSEKEREINELTAACERCCIEKEVLASRLTESNATRDLAQHTVSALGDEVSNCHDRVQDVTAECDLKDAALAECRQALIRFSKVFNEHKQKHIACMDKLQSLQWRVEFAGNRVAMVRDLRCVKPQRDDVINSPATSSGSSADSPGDQSSAPSSSVLMEQLRAELERVCRERDQLAVKLRVESEKFAVTLQDNEEAAGGTVRDLSAQLETERCQLADLHQAHEATSADLVDAHERIRSLANSLADYEHSEGQEVQLKDDLKKCQQDGRRLEKLLSEAQQEHTKAAVAFQQTSRELERQKLHLADQIASERLQLDDTIARLQRRLQDMERERNLYLTTLRQEGHLKGLHENRKLPILHNTLLQPPSAAEETLAVVAGQASENPGDLRRHCAAASAADLNVQLTRDQDASATSSPQSLEHLRQLSLAVLCGHADH